MYVHTPLTYKQIQERGWLEGLSDQKIMQSLFSTEDTHHTKLTIRVGEWWTKTHETRKVRTYRHRHLASQDDKTSQRTEQIDEKERTRMDGHCD